VLGEIDELTLRQAEELVTYWNEHPPAHLVLAAAFEVKGTTKANASEDSIPTEEEIYQFVAMFGRG